MTCKKDFQGSIRSSITTHETSYKNPPVSSRWKPGQSGNPGGRPRKEKKPGDIFGLLLHELEQKIFINENGKKVELTKREVLVKQIVRKALMGDNKCLDFVLRAEQQDILPPLPKGDPSSGVIEIVDSYIELKQ